MSFPPPPPIRSELERYRLLAPKCGLRVSPICLGTMNFGEAWKEMLGEMSKEAAFEQLDHYYNAGGNFLDTANLYQNGESEKWIGEWMAKKGNRDELVICTKYTGGWGREIGAKILVNYHGNHYKSMYNSVEASLKKLGTTYIDIFYVHFWDHTTSTEELMQGLNTLVKNGKVLYLGISDTPAWVVADCNRYARDHGLAEFVLYQGKYNASVRDLEREILPMCRAQGMGVAPWAALGQGKFQSKKDIEARNGEPLRPRGGSQQTEADVKISEAMDKIGQETKTSVQAVALAYVRQKGNYIFPILGGRKTSHLQSNIDALTLVLTDAQMAALDGVSGFDVGFPGNMIGPAPSLSGSAVNPLMATNGHYSFPQEGKHLTSDQFK